MAVSSHPPPKVNAVPTIATNTHVHRMARNQTRPVSFLPPPAIVRTCQGLCEARAVRASVRKQ